MKLRLWISLFLLLSFTLSGCGEPKPRQWKEYVSTEHNFKAMFPGGEPMEGPKQSSNMPGGTMDSYVICRAEDKSKYEVVYSKLPDLYKNFPVDKLLNSLIDNTLKTTSASGVKKSDVTVSGFKGKDVEFDLPDNMAGRARIVAAGNRVYIAITKSPKESAASADVTKFIESLEIK